MLFRHGRKKFLKGIREYGYTDHIARVLFYIALNLKNSSKQMYIHTDTKMNTEGNAFNFLCVNVHGLKYIFRKNCTCTVDSQKVKQILNLGSYFLK